MLIKQQALPQQLLKKIASIYVVIGQDTYLLNESVSMIKAAIKNTAPCDEKILSINAAEDWNVMDEEANSYSLFSETVLLTLLYDKKTLDANGKKIITRYLDSPNPRCFIILRAPNLAAKQLAWLTNHQEVLAVTLYSLNAEAMKQWIVTQLRNNTRSISQQAVELIYQYTQGNMLACAQVIEKLLLNHPVNAQISTEQASEHLSDQCEYQVFELAETCLQGQSARALQILRQSANNKTESTLVLWVLTQEIRLLLQLHFLLQQKIDLKTATSQLKIWPQRTNLYAMANKRVDASLLRHLLSACQRIDDQIKSGGGMQVWNALEQVALALCLGSTMETTCIP